MRIGFIGAGSMASALARGVGEPALVSDVRRERAAALAAELGGEVAASNAELAERADIVILCHKPAQLDEVAAELVGRARAIVSIVAATPVARLEQAYPETPVYRFIPSIPVEVGRGVFCYAPGSRAAAGPEQELLELFARCGVVIALDEPLIEPAMALMSCGPAFLALVAEALADAGVRHGLEPRLAARLVTETLAGTAAYLDANDGDAAGLRARVATPGGLTEKGLGVLEESGLRRSFDAAVDLVVEAGA
ncbi:MAG: pyrroline-5-carboxylate reductase [Thermoleophilaceae bacterium]